MRVLAFTASLAIAAACTQSSNSATSTSGFCCQVNDDAWDCPDQSSLEKCSNATKPDPSSCTRRATGCDGTPASTAPGSSTSSTSTTSSSGTSGSNACTLFMCTNTAGCGGLAPCMSTNTQASYCYEQEGSADLCSQGTTPTTALVDGTMRTICVPPHCPEPVKWIP